MRALQLHLLLAIAALALAVGVRRRAADTPGGEGERLVDCQARAVRLESPERTVRVERHGGDVAVEVARRSEGGRARFVGGEAATELLDRVGALRAERTLADADADADADYGFAGASLVVRCEGDGEASEPHVFALGGEVYGSEDRYLRDAEGGVHVVAAAVVRALESAEVLLMRRELHPFDEAAVAQVVVTLPDGTEARLVQRFGDDPLRRRWVERSHPDRRAPRADRLMGALRNLRAEVGVEPDPRAEPLGTLRFLDDDEAELGTLEVARVGRGPGGEIHAHTPYVGWVRLPRSTGAAFVRALERLEGR